jgi:hypothetical protein
LYWSILIINGSFKNKRCRINKTKVKYGKNLKINYHSKIVKNKIKKEIKYGHSLILVKMDI